MHDLYDNKIFVIDNVLSKEECNELINFYKRNDSKRHWRETKPMLISMRKAILADKVIKIYNSVNKYLDQSLKIGWSEIVLWPIDSHQNLHNDTSSPGVVFTSITYLNDEYVGGRTYIENDIEFIPKVGRTVCFNGNFYKHGVTKVLNENRYTLPIWYNRLNTDAWQSG